MLGPRALSKPAGESAIDLLFVGVGMSTPKVLAHQPDAGIEQVEREAKCPGCVRR